MAQTQSAAPVKRCDEDRATTSSTQSQTDGSETPRIQLTMSESREAERKQRHRENLKLKRKHEKQQHTGRSQTFELRSCHCATPCSSSATNSTTPDFCQLYSTFPLPVISNAGQSKKTPLAIRLIRLKPGDAGNDLECDLFHAASLESVRFVALSYVWGDYHDRAAIRVSGRVVNITRSLHNALIHLRHASAETILWVDAICIDQGNPLERSSQVEHMPQIYSAAAEVIAWLGEQASGSEQAMDYMNSYTGAPDESSPQDQDSTPHTQLKSLWSRDYWGRVWVVQELASAHRSNGKCFIRCGHQSVSFANFRQFLTRFLNEQLYTKDDSMLGPKHLINLSTTYEGKSFLEILFQSASLHSTDPRDRIYGIRGISPEFYRNKIKVDYQIEFQQLCKTVITTYIKKEKDLGILCQFKGFPRHDRYPSWVRDLSTVIRGISPAIYFASAGSDPKTAIDDTTLHADGRCIGRADRLRGPFHFPAQIATDQPWPEMPNLGKIKNFTTTALWQRYTDMVPEDLEGRFMNIVSGDRWRGNTTQVPVNAHEIWDSISHHKTSSIVDEEMQLTYKYFTVIFSPLIGRTLFTTVGGSIGVGPPDMQKDDMICVLHGCSYCAVLRKVKKRHYIFIGPAYVDGAMSGEYIRQTCDDEGKETTDERFHIR